VPERDPSRRDRFGATDAPKSHRFGRWVFDADTGQLFDGASATQLQPQVARLLEYLLTHPGKVISRDELVAEVWANRAVSDDAIHRCVSILRKLLTPTDREEFIETVPRRGYVARFPPPAPSEDSLPDSKTTPAEPTPHRRIHLVLAAAATAAVLILAAVMGRRDKSPEDVSPVPAAEPPVVAVLPLAAVGETSESEFFAYGIHNDLLTQLAKLQSLRVISSTSVQGYRGSEHNIRQIGEQLGADVIMEGGVQVADNRIRINAQLIDARTDEHLWAENYERELLPEKIFAVQSEIALAIAESLNAALAAGEQEELSLIPTESMEAYRAFHRAMRMRDADSSALGSEEYRQALREAVELDPKFARAWAELAVNIAYEAFLVADPQIRQEAEEALRSLKAVAPGSAEYLIGEAGYVYYVVQDYDRAHDVISRALTMAPGDVHVIQLKSWIERRQGRFDARIETLREARRLDPKNPSSTDHLLQGLVSMHRYDEASALLEGPALQTYATGYWRNILDFREHRDAGRLEAAAKETCRLYDQPDCAWLAHVANRNYLEARDVLAPPERKPAEVAAPGNEFQRALTCWLMNDAERLAEAMVPLQERLETHRDEDDKLTRFVDYPPAALLAGAQGRPEEAERLIKLWYRFDRIDWAERVSWRADACRILGMIAATDAAVECIRDGLAEPSYVMPFLEPYLPFYDPIRNEQAFRDLTAEIDQHRPAGP